MQMFQNLPWYTYIIIGVFIISFLYRTYKKGRQLIGVDADLTDPVFRKSKESNLTQEQLFSISLYTVIAEWWEADINTLKYRNKSRIKPYMEGWGISTKEGYWDLTNYFMEDGRRWYFDFIFDMIKTKPESEWNTLMKEKFGDNNRAERYLNDLKSNQTINILKSNGFITFDSEIEIGVIGYDAAMLVGQARKAYTYELISEDEAWKVINFATQLAKNNFSSWEEFGKSFILGFTLDMGTADKTYVEEVRHLYKQILANPKSPWNTIQWK